AHRDLPSSPTRRSSDLIRLADCLRLGKPSGQGAGCRYQVLSRKDGELGVVPVVGQLAAGQGRAVKRGGGHAGSHPFSVTLARSYSTQRPSSQCLTVIGSPMLTTVPGLAARSSVAS